MRWHTILVPHDFSDGAARAWELACDLAELHDARLVLAHVSAPAHGVAPSVGRGSPGLAADEAVLISARRKLEGTMRDAPAPRSHVDIVARTGPVVETLLALVAEIGADAVVMGTHGRKGVSHLLLGSIAEKMVRACPVPVVTVRMDDPAVRGEIARSLDPGGREPLRGRA